MGKSATISFNSASVQRGEHMVASHLHYGLEPGENPHREFRILSEKGQGFPWERCLVKLNCFQTEEPGPQRYRHNPIAEKGDKNRCHLMAPIRKSTPGPNTRGFFP